MGEKITKEGSKNHQKYPKRSAKLINEGVTKSSKGMIYQGKKFLEEKLQKNFQGDLFLWQKGHKMNTCVLEGVKRCCTSLG